MKDVVDGWQLTLTGSTPISSVSMSSPAPYIMASNSSSVAEVINLEAKLPSGNSPLGKPEGFMLSWSSMSTPGPSNAFDCTDIGPCADVVPCADNERPSVAFCFVRASCICRNRGVVGLPQRHRCTAAGRDQHVACMHQRTLHGLLPSVYLAADTHCATYPC
eukprot:365278-Chlamydomonas_euryale.AAC.6